MAATAVACVLALGLAGGAAGAGAGAGAAGDLEWQEMLHSNPYPEVCAPAAFPTKDGLRLCIREHLWIDELPADMPRMSPGYYHFGGNRSKILPPRTITDPADAADCLKSTRDFVYQVPYDCYAVRGLHPQPDGKYYDAFFAQIFNELRFTFDFVLHEDPQLYIENNLWYLILYLKKIAMELQSPFQLIKLVHSTAEYKLDAENRLKGLRNQINELKTSTEEGIKALSVALENTKKNFETILSNKMK